MGPTPLGGSCEGGKVATLGTPFTGGDGVGGDERRSFGATEESAAIGVQRAKWRDPLKEDLCQPALTSLRGLSAHLP